MDSQNAVPWRACSWCGLATVQVLAVVDLTSFADAIFNMADSQVLEAIKKLMPVLSMIPGSPASELALKLSDSM